MVIYLFVNIEELGLVKILNNELTNHFKHDREEQILVTTF